MALLAMTTEHERGIIYAWVLLDLEAEALKEMRLAGLDLADWKAVRPYGDLQFWRSSIATPAYMDPFTPPQYRNIDWSTKGSPT